MRLFGSCTSTHATATQRVQRGTKCPSGNTNRNTEKHAAPANTRRATGAQRIGCAAESIGTLSGNVMTPNVSRVNAANNAMRSEERRQTSSAVTAAYASASAVSIATRYAA